MLLQLMPNHLYSHQVGDQTCTRPAVLVICIIFVILVVVDVADENLVNIQGRYGILDQYSWVSSIPLKWPSIY